MGTLKVLASIVRAHGHSGCLLVQALTKKLNKTTLSPHESGSIIMHGLGKQKDGCVLWFLLPLFPGPTPLVPRLHPPRSQAVILQGARTGAWERGYSEAKWRTV